MTYCVKALPPEYYESPMIFATEDGPELVMELAKDMAALQERQQQILSWYRSYMASKTAELEQALLAV